MVYKANRKFLRFSVTNGIRLADYVKLATYNIWLLEEFAMDKTRLLTFWIKVNELFEYNCNKMDLVWQKRKRILDTRLLVIFIFKIILSKNKQGYGSTIWQLWNTCNTKDIKLPQLNTVAASSLCEARQKLPENIFTILNKELLTLRCQHHDTPLWNGHRVFAIDGSKLNMPTGLLNYGFRVSKNSGRHYPNGMMSCLYNLHEQLVYDFELVDHNDERSCAINHFKTLKANDLVILDRGYFSYFMFYSVLQNNIDAVFRVQVGGTVNGKIQEFADSALIDTIIEYYPSAPVKHELKKRGHMINFEPLKIRLIKYIIKNQVYVCATTLMDQVKYPTECFSDLYHSRWGIEELYKVSKAFIDVEDFHSQILRTVRQELYAHLLLINIARIFELDSHTAIPKQEQQESKQTELSLSNNDSPPFKINFKNCLAIVGYYLEDLILASKTTIENWLYKQMKSVAKLKQRIRPNRSYPRVSHKPRNSWSSFRGAKCA